MDVKIEYKGETLALEIEINEDFEVFQFQIFSLTEIIPENQEYRIDGYLNSKFISNFNLSLLKNGCNIHVREISTENICNTNNNEMKTITSDPFPSTNTNNNQLLQNIMKAYASSATANQPKDHSLNIKKQQTMKAKLQNYMNRVEQYENPAQSIARAIVPIQKLKKDAKGFHIKCVFICMFVCITDALANGISYMHERDQFVIELLRWFKVKFFTWTNNVKCQRCGSSDTKSTGAMANPTADDLKYGALRVELHICTKCHFYNRFPRYNDPVKLLETRCGRCGEWANCFTFILRSLGYETTRFIIDFTDHVWTEYYSRDLQKWVHLDPCENTFDSPLMYEHGWGKKLNYCFAASHFEGIKDVTLRYTHKWREVLNRRNDCSEEWLESYCKQIQLSKTMSFSAVIREGIKHRSMDDIKVFQYNKNVDIQGLKVKYKKEELNGRITGSWQWRKQRGELGDDHNDCKESKEENSNVLLFKFLEKIDCGKCNEINFSFFDSWIDFGGNEQILHSNNRNTSPSNLRIYTNEDFKDENSLHIKQISCTYASDIEYHCNNYSNNTICHELKLIENETIDEIEICYNKSIECIIGLRLKTNFGQQKIIGYLMNNSQSECKLFKQNGMSFIAFEGIFNDNYLCNLNAYFAPSINKWSAISQQMDDHYFQNSSGFQESHCLLKKILKNGSKRLSKYHSLKCLNKKLQQLIFKHEWCSNILQFNSWMNDSLSNEWILQSWKTYSRSMLDYTLYFMNKHSPITNRLQLDVHSFGNDDDTGIRTSWIKINGDEYRVPGRGHGIVVLDVNRYRNQLFTNENEYFDISEELITHQSTFDTFGDENSGLQMQRLLQSVTIGSLVIICVHDSAECHWSLALSEMEKLGIKFSSRNKVLGHRESFILFGEKCSSVSAISSSAFCILNGERGQGPLRFKCEIEVQKDGIVVYPYSQAKKERAQMYVKNLVKKYYMQILHGCGDEKCGSKYCASNSELRKKNNAEAAKIAITLAKKHHNKYLCTS